MLVNKDGSKRVLGLVGPVFDHGLGSHVVGLGSQVLGSLALDVKSLALNLMVVALTPSDMG